MIKYTVAVLCLAAMAATFPKTSIKPRQLRSNYTFPFVTREEWEAESPTYVSKLNSPVSYVVMHHVNTTTICLTKNDCIQEVQTLQNTHKNINGWFDIAYNFAIGGEGSVFEGRGWDVVGAFATTVNFRSIGIAIIGNFNEGLPPAISLLRVKQLIFEGIKLGYISANYELVGHRDVATNTDCPGDNLYQEIRSWDPLVDYPFSFVTRDDWEATPPLSVETLVTPVQYVVIHHSVEPEVCMTKEACMRGMRAIQRYHQNNMGWTDFGFNFAVGGEGSVYEGRGWDVVGTHAAGVNSQSIGIVIIGNFVSELPPEAALLTTKLLIAEGVRRGYISENYHLIGHNQVTATLCPGEALFEEIKTWDNFLATDSEVDYPFSFVTRDDWEASPPLSVTTLDTPVPYVVIHHSVEPEVCMTKEACMRGMRAIQRYHQNNMGWTDFGFNFAVGGEGSVYEGRGWDVVGTHASGINSQSIGIVIIGNFVSELPPEAALVTTKLLIAEGVKRGYISEDYQLLGHNQVTATLCPGEALFEEIKTWDRFLPTDSEGYPFWYVNRERWGAESPRYVTSISTPVSYVVIHHTNDSGICLTRSECIQSMQNMQNIHQNTYGWFDIGYNFAVGGEGSVYQGRGWDVLGAYATTVNSRSIGIAIIGQFSTELPPAIALERTKQLILEGISRGYIKEDYQLVGHREIALVATESPGDALLAEIRTWDHRADSETGNLITFVTREDWGANPPVSVMTLDTPVPYVVIHHTVIPEVCLTKEDCMRGMRAMQNYHQNTNGWGDFGYNFAVGGEGSIYEGRGWEAVGAHAVGVNTQSIGIVIIGNFVSELPPAVALQAVKDLISVGVKLGYIQADYKLIGHRQVTTSECPGDALFTEIQTWEHFSATF